MPLNDLSDAIREFAETITVTRTLAPSVVYGRVQDAPQQTRFAVSASVQPLPSKELLLLPEGMRNQGTVAVFTKEKLRTVDVSAAKIPDTFEWHGATYQIAQTSDWSIAGNYTKYIATRMTR